MGCHALNAAQKLRPDSLSSLNLLAAKQFFSSLLCVGCLLGSASAFADDALADGKWRGSEGLAFSDSSGNSNTRSLVFTGDATRQTSENKITFHGQILNTRAESNGVTSTTANQWLLGSRYDENFSKASFGFVGLDFLHDAITLISLRSTVSAGMGYHLIDTPENHWNLLGGVDYRADEYSGLGVVVNNQLQTSFDSEELMLGEESTNVLTSTTTFKQSFVVNPNLTVSGERVTFNTSLAVAMNKTMNLTVTLQDRYNSLSSAPIKKNDMLFFTGINVKFGG